MIEFHKKANQPAKVLPGQISTPDAGSEEQPFLSPTASLAFSLGLSQLEFSGLVKPVMKE